MRLDTDILWFADERNHKMPEDVSKAVGVLIGYGVIEQVAGEMDDRGIFQRCILVPKAYGNKMILSQRQNETVQECLSIISKQIKAELGMVDEPLIPAPFIPIEMLGPVMRSLKNTSSAKSASQIVHEETVREVQKLLIPVREANEIRQTLLEGLQDNSKRIEEPSRPDLRRHSLRRTIWSSLDNIIQKFAKWWSSLGTD